MGSVWAMGAWTMKKMNGEKKINKKTETFTKNHHHSHHHLLLHNYHKFRQVISSIKSQTKSDSVNTNSPEPRSKLQEK